MSDGYQPPIQLKIIEEELNDTFKVHPFSDAVPSKSR
jgi:hypothetical protein